MPIRLVHITTVPESLWFLKGQASFMRERGIEVYAVSSPGIPLENFSAREAVPVYPVSMERRVTPLRDVVAIWRIHKVLSKIRPHIICSYTPKGGLLGMMAARLAGVPVRIYYILGLPMITAKGVRRFVLRWTETISCALSHQVLCVSTSVRDLAVNEGMCPPEKIKVLGNGSINGVDADGEFDRSTVVSMHREATRSKLGIPSEAVVLGYVGRVVREKGISELAQVWKVIREADPFLILLIVGNPEPQDPIPRDTSEYFRNDPRVRVTGYVDDVLPYYAAMDVYVLPTYREGLPVTLLEASALCLPVVATQVPGCVDAVNNGITGILVAARDSDSLAEALLKYVNQPELRRAHGEAGREWVRQRFRPENIWEELHGEYQRLLSKYRVIDRYLPETLPTHRTTMRRR